MLLATRGYAKLTATKLLWHRGSLDVDDRNMSRCEIGLTLLGVLAIGLALDNTVLWAEESDSVRATVFHAISWDGGELKLSDPSPVMTVAAEETIPPLDGGGDELLFPEEPFGELSQQMAYSGGSYERLIDRIVDPTSWLMNYRFRESWNWPVRNSGRDSEEFEFRPTIPFRAWGHVNVLRVTIPYTVEGPGGPGLDDVTFLDLIIHHADWGRWGVGPDFRMTPGGNGSFQIGPGAGAVTKDRYWTVGVLTQNFFADNVAETRVQPILAYKIDEHWAVGVGEFEFRYDWTHTDWTQVPFGVQVDYIADVYGQKIQFFANPQYNLESDSSNSGWTFFLGLSLLVPDA